MSYQLVCRNAPNSATPIGKLMSYQLVCRNVSDGVFVPLRQTGYASIQIRRTAAARFSGLPLNYTRKSGSYVSLRSG
jgi:hypothetical protein